MSDQTHEPSALAAVRAAIAVLEGCTDEEREALQGDLRELEQMEEKLEHGRVEIVVFGEISTGKSALINALIGDQRADVNVQGGWTQDIWRLPWRGVGHCVPGFADSQVVFVDTPGLNEVDGASRGEMARQAAARADLVLFVTDSDLNETEYSALVELAASHKPLLLVLNKIDLYAPEEREQLLTVFKGPRLGGLVDPQNVLTAAADPRPMEYVIEDANGTIRSEWRRPGPQVGDVRARVLEVLQRDGSALVALNAAMYAADKSDRIAAMRIRMREDRAQRTVWTYAVTKSLAVAYNPILLADVVGGTAVDLAMVANLAKIYGIRLTTANARTLVESILKAAGWVLLSEKLVTFACSFFKGATLGTGTPLTALPQGAAAGYGSYIVGQACRYYFEHGASWGGESPKTVVARILEASDKESILVRLREQIKQTLQRNRHAGSES